MTKFVKNSAIQSNWYEIDAKNAVVGRLATIISTIIRGKNKNTYVKTPTISKSVNIALFFCFCLCINGSNNQFCSSINFCTFA